MRMHIDLDEDLVAQVDELAGARGRSAFVRQAIRAAVDQRRRAVALQAAAGVLADLGHEWDDDPAAWVRAQRRDPRRAG